MSTTAAQLSANQANAQHSTGPRTEAGKAASSRNSTRHGFRSGSESILLPGDDPDEYQALLSDLTTHFEPCNLTEQRFVREMTDAEWRLRSVRAHIQLAICARIEALSEDPAYADADPIDLQRLALETLHLEGGTSYSTWLRYETKFERQYARAFSAWSAYQKLGATAGATQADALIQQVMTAQLPNSPAYERILASIVQNEKHKSTAPSELPRSAPCPCGSGEKYKRCCGKDAPPVLGQAA